MAFKEEENDTFQHEIALAIAIPYAKKIKAVSICPIHRKKRISITYDNEGVNAYVSKGCCQEFRRLVAQALKRTKRFDAVYIEEQ